MLCSSALSMRSGPSALSMSKLSNHLVLQEEIMKTVYKGFLTGFAIGSVVWTTEDGLEKMVEQLNFLAFVSSSSFVKIQLARIGVISRDAFQKIFLSKKSLLVARVLFQIFIGVLPGRGLGIFVISGLKSAQHLDLMQEWWRNWWSSFQTVIRFHGNKI